MSFQIRLAKLRRVLSSKHIGAFLITNPQNIYYLSGLKADDASLLITSRGNFIITDFRFKQEAARARGFKTRLLGNYKRIIIEILKDSRIKCAGFEAGDLSYARAQQLKNTLHKEKIRFAPLAEVVETLRQIKDAAEIKKIREAISIAKKAFCRIKSQIRPGVSEKQLSLELDYQIRAAGGDGNSFPSIVASGKNSSRPHAAVTDKVIKKGEPVLIDFGVTLGSYNCDLTRTCFLGKIPKLFSEIYDICSKAQALAISRIRPGVSAKEIDGTARGYIESKGFGKFFGHSTGHGVGLDVHELPRISPASKYSRVLEPNMVFTVEPGIYMDKIGGVRIEDMVQVTGKGCEILTDDVT